VVAIIQKISSSWKNSKNYLKHKGNGIRFEDLILRLRIENDDKLTKKRTNSSSALKVNVMEQMVRSHNKNKKSLLWKVKELPKSSMTSVLSITKLGIWPKIAETWVSKETLWKGLLKPMSPRLITLLIKFQKWTCLMLFLKSTLSKILSSAKLKLVLQDRYALRRWCFSLTNKWMEKTYIWKTHQPSKY